eukprot:COSAG05_NODE_895_length_6700_cov_14.354189_1_plen_78_part_00
MVCIDLLVLVVAGGVQIDEGGGEPGQAVPPPSELATLRRERSIEAAEMAMYATHTVFPSPCRVAFVLGLGLPCMVRM